MPIRPASNTSILKQEFLRPSKWVTFLHALVFDIQKCNWDKIYKFKIKFNLMEMRSNGNRAL